MAKQAKHDVGAKTTLIVNAPADKETFSEPVTGDAPIDALTEAIRQALAEFVGAFFSLSVRTHRIGTNLMAVKAKKPHGEFARWAEQSFAPELGMSMRTMQRFMQRARDLNRQIEDIRSDKTTIVTDLTDEQIIERYSLVPHSIKHVGTNPDPKPSKRSRRVMSRGRSGTAVTSLVVSTPPIIARRVAMFLEPLDVIISDANESNELVAANRIQGIGAFATPLTLQPRMYVNGVTVSPLGPPMTELACGYDEGAIQEALLLLPADQSDEQQFLIRGFPRVLFHIEPDFGPELIEELSDAHVLDLILVYLGSPHRLPDLHSTFIDIGGEVYVPFRCLGRHSSEVPVAETPEIGARLDV